MAQPYIGEIRMFAGNFAPVGWLFCDGQLIPISENDALFTLIGTTYGGDGQATFALPNLQSRVPMHFGTGPTGIVYQIGQAAGTEQETLSIQQMPAHRHALIGAAVNGDQQKPTNNLHANSFNITPYINQSADGAMSAQSISPAGGSQPHENCQPFLCINYIISLFGLFPQQT